MLNFIKSVFVGIGGVAPGLSGSVLLVIFGLYQQVVDAIGTLFKDFRKNVAFLLPLAAGVVVGVLLFSKVVDRNGKVGVLHVRLLSRTVLVLVSAAYSHAGSHCSSAGKRE